MDHFDVTVISDKGNLYRVPGGYTDCITFAQLQDRTRLNPDKVCDTDACLITKENAPIRRFYIDKTGETFYVCIHPESSKYLKVYEECLQKHEKHYKELLEHLNDQNYVIGFLKTNREHLQFLLEAHRSGFRKLQKSTFWQRLRWAFSNPWKDKPCA